MLKIDNHIENPTIIRLIEEFCNNNKTPKFVFGRNEYARSVIENFEIDGVIDDFTSETTFFGKPIIPIFNVPNNAIVINVVIIGKPLLAEKRIRQFQFKTIDYYSLLKYTKKIIPIKYLNGFIDDFKINGQNYETIYERLNDKISKNQFYNIINFRLSYDLYYMRGFSPIEHKQYFEDILSLEIIFEIVKLI